MKKGLKIGGGIIAGVVAGAMIVVVVAATVLTVVVVNTVDDPSRTILGYKLFIVLSDSMNSVDGDESKGYFGAGDIIAVKEVDPETLEVGDIISYQSTNTEIFGEVVHHMIKEKTSDPGFITYSTAVGTTDTNVVTYEYVLGEFSFSIPGLGYFIQYILYLI